MADWWEKVAKKFAGSASFHKIKFVRGVVGKLAGIAIVVLVTFAYMTRNVSPDKAFIVVMVAAGLVVLVIASILIVALAKPELAVMEGMELIHYKRVSMASRDFNPDKELPPIPDPGLPELSSDSEGEQ